MEIKLVLNDVKSGKAYKKLISEEQSKSFIGLKIKDKFKGELIELVGYEFEITGGSDNAGFPMRWDVNVHLKKILAIEGVGLKKKRKGNKVRKTVAGNMITDKTSQINAKTLKEGKESLQKLLGSEQAEQSSEQPAETTAKPPEQSKEQPKEEKKEKTESPKEKHKAEEKVEEKPAKN